MVDVLSPSTALAFVTKMSEKCKCTSPSANQVKNQPNTISTEEKLDVLNQLEKGEKIVDTCRNVRFTHSSVHTVSDNVDRSTESGRTGTKVFL
jgi:hypothetical protein